MSNRTSKIALVVGFLVAALATPAFADHMGARSSGGGCDGHDVRDHRGDRRDDRRALGQDRRELREDRRELREHRRDHAGAGPGFGFGAHGRPQGRR